MARNKDASKEIVGPYDCKCKTLATKLIGDGCEICNPEYAEEIRRQNALDELAEQAQELDMGY